jgi:glycosyltransferase involved in cell wall biosynthesis
MGALTLGIDGWRLHGQLTGVGRYISNVLRHWTEEAVEDRFARVTLYTPAPVDRSKIDLPDAIEESVVGPHWRQLLWQNLRLARAARDDILFCPSYARPLTVRGKTVVTTFEATQKLVPDLYPRYARLVNTPLYGWSARASALVITTSAAAAQDIVRAYGVDGARLRVIHLAASDAFCLMRGDATIEVTCHRYLGTGDPFFLYVGKLTGRRNIPLLIEAFAEFKRRTALPHRLLLVGLNTTNVPVARLATDSGVAEDVRHYDHVSDVDLNRLYNGAQSFVLPYTYEAGFSLTALEAQVTGTPVITVDTPGLRESTGSAALFVPRAEVRQIAEAMYNIAENAPLRSRLADAGLENSARFSWRRAAAETLAVLAEAAGGAGAT